jgi:hypothetical protein
MLLLAVPLTRARYYLAGQHLVPTAVQHATPMVQGFRAQAPGTGADMQERCTIKDGSRDRESGFRNSKRRRPGTP